MWLADGMTGKPAFGEAAFQGGRALLMNVAFGLALLQMAYRGESAGGQRRRQLGRKDETRRVAAQEVDERRRAGDIAPEALSEKTFVIHDRITAVPARLSSELVHGVTSVPRPLGGRVARC